MLLFLVIAITSVPLLSISLTGNECYPSLNGCTSDSNCHYNLKAANTTSGYADSTCNLASNFCTCDVFGYNLYTCLPDLYGCTMCQSSPSSSQVLDATPSDYPGYIDGYIYYCLNNQYNYTSLPNEIRTVGIYEPATFDGDIVTVNLRTCGSAIDLSKPISIILTNYDAVAWLISSNDQNVIDNIQFSTIQAWTYNTGATSISFHSSLSSKAITTQIRYSSSSSLGRGYGNDQGGSSTAKMLYNIPIELGEYAFSFIGKYSTNYIDLCVGNQGALNTFSIVEPTQNPTDIPSKMPSAYPTDVPSINPTQIPSTMPVSIQSTESNGGEVIDETKDDSTDMDDFEVGIKDSNGLDSIDIVLIVIGLVAFLFCIVAVIIYVVYKKNKKLKNETQTETTKNSVERLVSITTSNYNTPMTPDGSSIHESNYNGANNVNLTLDDEMDGEDLYTHNQNGENVVVTPRNVITPTADGSIDTKYG